MSSPCLGMQGSKQFKQALLKNLLLGLRKRGVVSREMSFHDRKNAIKHAADAALASARGGAPCWSRSLAAELAHRRTRGTHRSSKPPAELKPSSSKMICKKVLRRSLRSRPRKATAKAYGGAGVLARAMVRKRTMVLKEIVPGGKALDECTLLGETLDYARSLKAQVDIMQLLCGRSSEEELKIKVFHSEFMDNACKIWGFFLLSTPPFMTRASLLALRSSRRC